MKTENKNQKLKNKKNKKQSPSAAVFRDSPGVKDPWQQLQQVQQDAAKTWLLPILMILRLPANQRPPPPFPQDPEPAPDHGQTTAASACLCPFLPVLSSGHSGIPRRIAASTLSRAPSRVRVLKSIRRHRECSWIPLLLPRASALPSPMTSCCRCGMMPSYPAVAGRVQARPLFGANLASFCARHLKKRVQLRETAPFFLGRRIASDK